MTEPVSPLAKTFDFTDIESRWTHQWESTGAFRPHRPDAEPFTIVNPPPNVTGSLHIGHALDNTLQDILIRHARLQGKDALWVVGMDHAGIATQMVVERQLEANQDKRTNYTRDAFVDKVWEWKAESGGQITGQLRRLGCSMDWSREQFTMDPHFTKAVTKVFVDLYNQGLLYRDKRLVNWDPKFKTAISDLEVETVEVQGHMWHFKYPLAGGETYTYVERDPEGNVTLSEERDYIAIATTRPETMLGDGAVAVHPGDERYRPIVGKFCEIPVGPKAQRRLIPIITDEYPDPDFGSGAVKITGAHDQNDYMVAQRNSIPMYRLMDDVAAMRSDGPSYAVAAACAKEIAAGGSATTAEIDALNLVPDAYRGLDRYEARKAVVADIDADGLMLRVEDKTIMQPFGDRSGVVIEPMLTDQWYVDAKTLAWPPIEAVRSGAIEIVPKSWEKTFFNWMENIQPWCVSRQLWWGHRIPAWYGEDGQVYVAENATAAQDLAGEGVALTQDDDVLDTWFSSALWPFATLGWPEGSEQGTVPSEAPGTVPESQAPTSGVRDSGTVSKRGKSLLHRHYPNDVLVSGFDILFFWDARMAMQGMHFMGEPPWKTLYLHGLVRAADGSKMSKSKGNTVDPLILMDKYGADALRFFMAAMESQGRDIKMDERRVEGYRNFATKLWNAARFCQSNGIGASETVAAPEATLAVNKWIIGEVVETLAKLDKAFAEFRFDAMADAIYQFTWGTFCDWYLELIKPVLGSGKTYEHGQPLDGADNAVKGTVPSEAPGTVPESQLPVLSARDSGTVPKEGQFLGEAAETRRVAGWVLDQILVMLHPFMPFITEELWDKMGERGGNLLIHAEWPKPEAEVDAEAKGEVEWLIELVAAIRSGRTELNVPPGAVLPLRLSGGSKGIALERVVNNRANLKRLARVDYGGFGPLERTNDFAKVHWDELAAKYAEEAKAGSLFLTATDFEGFIPLEGIIDLDAERSRIRKSIEALTKEAASLSSRLNNPAFVEKAKPEAVEKARADHAEKAAEVERLSAALARLG